MHPRIYWLLMILLCSHSPAANTYEYCQNEPSLCEKEAPHIICHPEQIVPDGKLTALAPMTEKFKRLVLHEHNKYRNSVACGNTNDSTGSNYMSATRMRILIWDDELAYVAQAHAKRCNMTHDKCRKTVRFPKAGQNLALKKSSKTVKLLDDVTERIKDWFNEHLLGPLPEDMGDFSIIGHFTVMVNDGVSRLGCAVALCEKDDDDMKYRYHTTCNYEYTNIIGKKPYNEGSTGSQCEQWGGAALSNKYECLCENTGEIFPNYGK